MPTNYTQSRETFDSEVEVLATLEGLRSIKGITVDPSYYAANAISNKVMPPGMFIVKTANGMGRPYPGSYTQAVTSTSSDQVQVKDAAVFAAGDDLVIMSPHAQLNLTGTWANDDTATITINGKAITHTVSAFTTLTALATAIAATINGSVAGRFVTAIANGETIHLIGNTETLYSLAVASTTAGDGAIAIEGGGSALASGTSVGTVSSVDADTNEITLDANASVAIPAGVPIGLETGSEILGMTVTPIDLKYTSNDVACYTSASVWAARLPYWDAAIAEALPEITLVP